MSQLSTIDELITTLKADVTPEAKIEAIKSIGYSKNIRALDHLVSLLEDQNSEVRSAAIWAIGKYKDKDKLPKIIPKIKDGDEQVRTVALKTLAKFTSNPEILGEFFKLLEDEDANIRKMVLSTVVEFDANNILDKILERIEKDVDKEVKLKAIELSGDYLFKDKKAVDSLIDNLEKATDDFEIQMAIVDQLSKIDPYIKEFLMLALKGRKKIFIEDALSSKDAPVDFYRRNSPLVMRVRNFKEEVEMVKQFIEFLCEKNMLVRHE